MLAGLGVGVEEDVHMVAFDSAAAVLCGVDDATYHNFAAIGDDARVYRNGVVGFCDGAGAGAAAPALGALFGTDSSPWCGRSRGILSRCAHGCPQQKCFLRWVWAASPFT